MSNAREILAEVKAKRLRAEAEASVDADQRQLEESESKLLKQAKKSWVPQLTMVLFSVLGLGLLVLYIVDFFKNPAGDRGLFGFALPVFGFVYLGINALQTQALRIKALAELIRLNAPDLHEKLKDEGAP